MTRKKLNERFPAIIELLATIEARPFTVEINDEITLSALFIAARPTENLSVARGTILLLHGIASRKEMMIEKARILIENGYNAVLYDLRAHGDSGGLYCTFGYKEKYDVSAVITNVLELFGEKNCGAFGILGSSMGGAVALQAMAIEPRITTGIIESAFAQLQETIDDYARNILPFYSPWIVDIARRQAEKIADFRVCDVAPECSAKYVSQPCLLIHGSDDERIRVEYAERNYTALASEKKHLYIVSGAHHLDVRQVGDTEYQTTLLHWLDTSLVPHNSQITE